MRHHFQSNIFAEINNININITNQVKADIVSLVIHIYMNILNINDFSAHLPQILF